MKNNNTEFNDNINDDSSENYSFNKKNSVNESANKTDNSENSVKDSVKTEKNKKINKWLNIISIVLAIIIAFNIGYFSHYLFSRKNVRKTSEIVRLIDKFGYVYDNKTGEKRQLTEKDYADALVNGILDKYGKYYTQAEFDAENFRNKGNYKNFGFSVSNYSNHIVKVIGNSSADNVGIEYGDRLQFISFDDGEKISVTDSNSVTETINNHPDAEKFLFYISKEGEDIVKCYELFSSSYKVGYCSYRDSESSYDFRPENDNLVWKMTKNQGYDFLDNKTCYIKLSQFEGNAYGQIMDALNTMKNRNRTKLILDLRSNGGGDMSVLTDIAGCFMMNGGKKPVVAIAENNSGYEYFHGSSKPCEFIEKMSVIANDGTASASECLMGALITDNKLLNMDRVVIEKDHNGVGKTFGKGIMQTTYTLIGGGAFKLTTARILWPDKTTCIHDKGVIVTGDNATDLGISSVKQAFKVLN